MRPIVGLVRVGLFCGSLGARSANAEVLRVAAGRLEAAGHVVQQIDSGSVPPFDPQIVDEAPSQVEDFRDQLLECDVVLIAAPEYAAGLAGSTKNALDWLVGDSTIYRKVIGVASASTTGGTHAIEQLVRTISWQGGWVMAMLGVAAPRTKSDEHGKFDDAATVASIEQWVETVVNAFEGTAALRLSCLTAVVSQFGIDPARFGDIE